MKRMPALVAGGAAIVLAALLVASPASAGPATLPSGQRITIVEMLGDGDSQTYQVDPADAVSSPVGATNEPDLIEAIDVDDDGLGYATGYMVVDGGTVPALWRLDANTGVLSDPVPITIDLSPDPSTISSCPALDLLPDRKLVIICENVHEGPADLISYLGHVDPLTGAIDLSFEQLGLPEWGAIATDPTSGQLYGFGVYTQDADTFWQVWTLDLVNDTQFPGATIAWPVYGADFDRNGQLFVTSEEPNPNDVELDQYSLATLNTSSGDLDIVGPYVGSGTDAAVEFVQGLTVWGRPALPATGPGSVLPIGIGTALLFLAGAAFIATSRIQRRSE